MNYSEMSDFEINKLVAESQFDGPEVEIHEVGTSVEVHDISGHLGDFDYCNSWADAGPIIESEQIDLWFDDDGWNAGNWSTEINDINGYNSHKNPLRAAMICFLMMKESDSGEGASAE